MMTDLQKSDPIALEDAQKVRVEQPVIDEKVEKEKAQFAHTENMQNAQLGLMGRFWGSKSEKPGNISAIILILLVCYLGVLIFSHSNNSKFDDVFSGITSIITLILGYLFGSSDRR